MSICNCALVFLFNNEISDINIMRLFLPDVSLNVSYGFGFNIDDFDIFWIISCVWCEIRDHLLSFSLSSFFPLLLLPSFIYLFFAYGYTVFQHHFFKRNFLVPFHASGSVIDQLSIYLRICLCCQSYSTGLGVLFYSYTTQF